MTLDETGAIYAQMRATQHQVLVDDLLKAAVRYTQLGVEQAVVSSTATLQPENLYLHSFRLFAFPTWVSVQFFAGCRPH
jgi:hypothetical protein